MALKDLTGKTFWRLTVLERDETKPKGHQLPVYWRCRCTCGNIIVTSGNNLVKGHTKSCGCLHKEGTRTTHSFSHTPIHNQWCGIKQRCFNPHKQAYKNYGRRGITMYPAWIHDFQAFYDYVSKLPHYGEKGYSLDRINNDGNYEPGNLRFADKFTQARNKRNNVIVEYQGQKMTLPEAAEKSGLPYKTLFHRHKIGDRGERLFRPLRKNKTALATAATIVGDSRAGTATISTAT